MKELTAKEVYDNWETNELDTDDLDLMKRFLLQDCDSWVNISYNAAKLYRYIADFPEDEPIEPFSLIDTFLSAIALAGWQAAIDQVVLCLGIENKRKFNWVLDSWSNEPGQTKPPSIKSLKKLNNIIKNELSYNHKKNKWEKYPFKNE